MDSSEHGRGCFSLLSERGIQSRFLSRQTLYIFHTLTLTCWCNLVWFSNCLFNCLQAPRGHRLYIMNLLNGLMAAWSEEMGNINRLYGLVFPRVVNSIKSKQRKWDLQVASWTLLEPHCITAPFLTPGFTLFLTPPKPAYHQAIVLVQASVFSHLYCYSNILMVPLQPCIL